MAGYIPTVFLCKDEYGRVTTAGWAYEQDDVPSVACFRQWARVDWQRQIVDWVREYPIDTVQIRHRRRPLVEYSLEAWAKKEKLVAAIAAILVVKGDKRW